MILDTQSALADAQAVTATAISANVLDTASVLAGAGASISPNGRVDFGQGTDLYLVVQTLAAATDTGSDATLTVTLESADDAALSTNAIVHFSTGALAFATFSPAGTRIAAVRLPSALYRRYLGCRFTVASGPLTAGAFSAYLTADLSANNSYRSNFRVQ
jgi:hypothetical protein